MNGPAKLFKKKARIPLPDPNDPNFPKPPPKKPTTSNIMSGFGQSTSVAPGTTIGTVPTGPTGPTGPQGPDQPPFDPTTQPEGYTPEIEDSTADLLQLLKDQGYFESLGILEGLPPGMKEQMMKNLQDMMSGGMFDPYKSQSDESFVRAAQQMRSQAGGMFAPQLGQGAATKGMQGIEQGIMGGLTDKQLADQIAKGELMQKGTMMGMDLAKANEMQSQFLKEMEFKYQNLSSNEQQLLAQLKTQKELTGMNIVSNEKLAADQNWLQQQGIDMEHAKLYGYTDQNGNWVKGLLEINQEKWGLEQQEYHDQQIWDQLNLALQAGDYDTVNKLSQQLGLNTIDWTKVEDREKLNKLSEGMQEIVDLIDLLGPDADPALIAKLAKQYGELWKQKQELLGNPFSDEDLDAIVNGIGNGDISPENADAFNNYLSDTVIDWWNNGMGKNVALQLEGDASAWYDTLMNPDASDEELEEAAKNLSSVIWAAYQQDSGAALTDKQKQILKDSGLYAGDTEGEDQEELDKIVDQFIGGLKSYGSLKGASATDHRYHDVYNRLMEDSPTWEKKVHWKHKGEDMRVFDNPPDKNTYIMYEGKLVYVTSGVSWEDPDNAKPREYFMVTDVNTGENIKITATR